MQDFNRTMSAALVAWMSDHGVSRQRVAAYLDRSADYVGGRLSAKHDLSLDIIRAVAELSDTTPEALWIWMIANRSTGQGSSDR